MIVVLLVVSALLFGYFLGSLNTGVDHARLRALRWVLREDTAPATTPPELTRLREDLVAAGWVHANHVKDPAHFDECGRYLYWGE